jgi:hypothetical protein
MDSREFHEGRDDGLIGLGWNMVSRLAGDSIFPPGDVRTP